MFRACVLAGWLADAMNRPSGKPVILTFRSLVDPPAMIRLLVAIFTSSSLRGEIIIKPQKQVKGVEGSALHSFHPICCTGLKIKVVQTFSAQVCHALVD